MRIVGGALRGRVLQGPKSHDIRPTSDRARETLFNIIQHRYADNLEGSHILDLFAGTGALAFEALSRGAAFATLVDQGREAKALIKANATSLKVEERLHLLPCSALALQPCKRQKAKLVFCDPPYGHHLGTKALQSAFDSGWLGAEALIILEDKAGFEPEALLPPFATLLEKRVIGAGQFLFAAFTTSQA